MEWRDIKDYDNLYQVNEFGDVKSLEHTNNRGILRKECILSIRLTDRGYNRVVLYNNGVSKSFMVHRLVATAFINNPNNKPQVNHINGNKLDNKVENLEWVTISENQKHAFKIGLNKVFSKRDDKGRFIKKNANNFQELLIKQRKNKLCSI
jgi:hypothetical protein